MTEVVSLNEPDHKVVVERHYEAGPPEGLEIVETGDTIAITKEEEWVSKKTREVVNTKQIETRIKRQVVLEDGKVVEDSGPVVTTNTTEDTETQQHHQTELKKLGEDDNDEKKALDDKEARKEEKDPSKWIMVPNPDGLVREVNEHRVISREETEDTKETEDIQHFGDISDEAFIAAVNSGKSDLRPVLKSQEIKHSLVSTGAQLINESHRSKKVTDTEETKERSSVLPDGRIVSETRKTTEHEEVKDDELPEGVPDQNQHLESHQRFFKSRDQEEIDYVADGVKVGHDMRFRGETTEAERRGDGIDDPDWDSLSARAKRRQNGQQSNRQQVQRVKALENGVAIPSASPLDRKDALTKKPLDFDKEEETRKNETSKWLEHHFGSESRSSRDSLDEIEDEPEHTKQTKTSFFNVTIKSQPAPQTDYSTTTKVQQEDDSHRYYTSVEKVPEEEYQSRQTKHFQGIKEWNEREKEIHTNREHLLSSPVIFRENSSPVNYLQERYQRSPPRDYRTSPQRETSPIAPQRKRTQERPQTLIREENTRFDSGYRTLSRNEIDREPLEEPPPDYSPTTPPRAVTPNKKLYQKTRFSSDTPPSPPPQPTKVKSGNIIGQSIRKLVGKIRSASAERKAKQQQRAKRSPSPTYKKGNVIDNIHESSQNGSMMQNGGSRRSGSPGPVHRYYLGEDPFGGSIYGRENKYDGVRPARPSRKHESRVIQEPEEYRSHSTLGRFGKSFNRIGLTPPPVERNSQTLPRHLSKHEKPIRLEKSDRSNSTINVSFINTVSTPNKPIVNGGPAKPARTYRSNLSRSKSFNVDLDSPHLGMNKFNPQLQAPTGLKSPGLISSISRSQRDLTVDQIDNGKDYMVTSRFARNGNSDNKRIFLKDLRQRAPELYKTLHEEEKDDSWNAPMRTSTPLKNSRNLYNGDIYEPPTRLRESPNFKDSFSTPSGLTSKSVIRRGSNSSNDYSESYHTTTRNDDPVRPSVTNTVKSFSKKTVPTNDGRNYHTIESTETKSITKSRYHGDYGNKPVKFYENKMNGISTRGPVVIEVRNNYK